MTFSGQPTSGDRVSGEHKDWVILNPFELLRWVVFAPEFASVFTEALSLHNLVSCSNQSCSFSLCSQMSTSNEHLALQTPF